MVYQRHCFGYNIWSARDMMIHGLLEKVDELLGRVSSLPHPRRSPGLFSLAVTLGLGFAYKKGLDWIGACRKGFGLVPVKRALDWPVEMALDLQMHARPTIFREYSNTEKANIDFWSIVTAFAHTYSLRRITDVLHFQEWVWTGLILERGGGFQLLNQLIDLILPSGFLVQLVGQQQGRGDVGRTLSVRMMNGEASCSGLLVDTLSRLYASDDGEAVWVFLSIPSVDVPLAPSICVNNDGEASLQGAVRVFLSTPSVHISSAPSVVQPGYFGILRRWYNNVGKGHRKWVVDVGKNWDNVLEIVRWSYWVSSLVAFDWVWIWIELVWFSSLVLGQGEWSHALLASVDPQVHGLVTTLVPRLIGVATVRTRVLDARGSPWAAIPLLPLELGRSDFGKVPFRSDWTPPSIPHAYAAGQVLLLLRVGPSTHQASSLHQPNYGMPSAAMYHLSPIPLTYQYIQGGICLTGTLIDELAICSV
ncbi:hypothetical protein LguiA_017469 [Lonicera macranthoides]